MAIDAILQGQQKSYTKAQTDTLITNYVQPNPEITNSEINLNTVQIGNTKYKSPIVRKNLLRNWYFVGGGDQQGNKQFPLNSQVGTITINGNEVPGYEGLGMAIDGWYIRNSKNADQQRGNPTLEIQSDGIVFTTDGITAEGFSQAIPYRYLLGKTITISCLILENTTTTYCYFGLYSAKSSILNTTPRGSCNFPGEVGLFSKTVTLPTSLDGDTDLIVSFWRGSNPGKLKIAAVKLEIGDTQTLAHKENGEWVLNEIPNYEDQILQCQTDTNFPLSVDASASKLPIFANNDYIPTITWEKGGFSTPNWIQASSDNFIRFVQQPKLSNVKAVKVDITGSYKVYFGIYGWNEAIIKSSSFTQVLSETDKTLLNLAVCRNPASTDITVDEVANNIKVTFILDTFVSIPQETLIKTQQAIPAIFSEINGLKIYPGSNLKIGLYGASIVKGTGVSETVQGDLVEMDLIGGTNFYKNASPLTWGNQFATMMQKRYGITVENWAVGATTAKTYYEYLKASKENGNNPLNTNVDIAIIMMGNNGRNVVADVENAMRVNISYFVKIINLFRSQGTQIFFMTPTMAFDHPSYTLNTYQIMQCTKIAAEEAGANSLDAFHWIEDYCDSHNISIKYIDATTSSFLNSDQLHPSDLGHEIIFKCVKSLLKL